TRGCQRIGAGDHHDVVGAARQLLGQRGQPLGSSVSVAVFDEKVLSFNPSELAHAAAEAVDVRMRRDGEPADAGAPRLLRARGAGPTGGERADKGDKFAPLHSIASSARASSAGGTSIPSALAVLRLMLRIYLVGCSTGRSAGEAPLRIFFKRRATPRKASFTSRT